MLKGLEHEKEGKSINDSAHASIELRNEISSSHPPSSLNMCENSICYIDSSKKTSFPLRLIKQDVNGETGKANIHKNFSRRNSRE